jgi:hypothetical protein
MFTQYFTITINDLNYHIELTTKGGLDRLIIKNAAGQVICEKLGQVNPLRSLWLSDSYRNAEHIEREKMEFDCVRKSVMIEICKRENGKIAA